MGNEFILGPCYSSWIYILYIYIYQEIWSRNLASLFKTVVPLTVTQPVCVRLLWLMLQINKYNCFMAALDFLKMIFVSMWLSITTSQIFNLQDSPKTNILLLFFLKSINDWFFSHNAWRFYLMTQPTVYQHYAPPKIV